MTGLLLVFLMVFGGLFTLFMVAAAIFNTDDE